MSASNLEMDLYLTKPIPLAGDMESVAQHLAKDQEILATAINLNKSTIAAVENINNPQTHNVIGAISQYLNWEDLVKGIKGLKEKIGNYYQIKIPGKKIRLTYHNLISYFEYRVKRVKEGLIGLKMIPEIKKDLQELPGSIAEYMALS
jgi:hypothetical protein